MVVGFFSILFLTATSDTMSVKNAGFFLFFAIYSAFYLAWIDPVFWLGILAYLILTSVYAYIKNRKPRLILLYLLNVVFIVYGAICAVHISGT